MRAPVLCGQICIFSISQEEPENQDWSQVLDELTWGTWGCLREGGERKWVQPMEKWQGLGLCQHGTSSPRPFPHPWRVVEDSQSLPRLPADTLLE
jgi:hypothetical protein